MKRTPLFLAFSMLIPAAALAQAPERGAGPHDRERAKTLDELVVTASPLRPGSEDVVQPVVVIAGEDLDAKKAGTIGETVAREVGVQSSYFGAGVGRPIIRGQEGARVQVLENGIGALDVSTVSVDHAVSIEPFLADQIEILKGPATLLYGSGAVGGAVNVVDGRIPEALPDAGFSGRAELRGNTGADERTGMVRVDGGAGHWAWHADAFRRETSDYDIPGFAESEAAHEGEHEDEHDGHEEERGAFGRLPNSALETEGGALGASWIGDRGFFGAAVSTYRTEYGIPGHAHAGEHGDDGEEEDHDEGEHGEETVRIDLEQVRYDVKGAWLEPFAGAEALRVRLGRNDYEHVELEGDEIGTRFENRGLEGRAELVHALGAWRGAAGLQIGQRDFEAIGEEAFVPPSESRDLGLFWLGERDAERWKFEAGARVDRIDIDPVGAAARDFDALSLSLGTIWRATDALHLSLGVDRAERAPTAEELYSDGAHLATQSFEVGDSTLDTEIANQIELGAHLHVGSLSAKLALFQTRHDDFIYLDDGGEESEGLPLRFWTQADATFRGFEAEATLRLADNDSGAWDLRFFGDKVRASLDAGGALPRIVPARFGAGLAWKRDGWRASLGAIRHQDQDKVAAFETPTEGYTLVDAHLAWHVDGERVGWEVFVDGTNLTDREARAHSSFLKDLAPLPGRSIAFGVRAFF
jgi:iron complex outermembrane receptor protein